MFIKLLCVNTVKLCIDNYSNDYCIINEGDIVGALINDSGIRIEYKKNNYSFPYRFKDIENNFILDSDEVAYKRIYKRVNNLKLFFNNGQEIYIGDATLNVNM